jgi:hypothetical protein
MDRLARYGKETAIGGAVLMWVLGAPTAAQALPSVVDTFQGSFCISCPTPNTHHKVSLFFVGHDKVNCDPFLNCPEATVTGIPCGNSTQTFSFAGDVCSADAGDSWTMSLAGYSLCCGLEQPTGCGNTTTNTFISRGQFCFIPDCPSGCVTDTSLFAFTDPDPINVQNGAINNFTVAVPAAPEMNAENVASPLAVALATLLVLSDPRRKKPVE